MLKIIECSLTAHDLTTALGEGRILIDIETTGLSPKFHFIYMIGLIYQPNNSKPPILTQWFCESSPDEYELLMKLGKLIQKGDQLITYNGDRFDLSFIKKRMGFYGLSLPETQSLDIMVSLRPLKKWYDLDNMKLTTLTTFLGLNRLDLTTGKELIKVYERYTERPSDLDLDILALHNHDDMIGLLGLWQKTTSIMALKQQLIDHEPLELIESSLENGVYKASFLAKGLIDLPKSQNQHFTWSSHNQMVRFEVPIIVQSLKHFFPDYDQYYYLPEEDYAVHKSIGQFIPSSHRIKATARTAYVKKDGFFAPMMKHFNFPLPHYYAENSSDQAYVSIEDMVETDTFSLYIKTWLKSIF